jgi:hypothetical protein
MKIERTEKNTREVFRRWQSEDCELSRQLAEIRQWMLQVGERGTPRFGETGSRLSQLRSYLVLHFKREGELCDELEEMYKGRCPEVEAVRRQSTHDHQQLLSQLDDLIAELIALEPPFTSWQTAMDRVEWFADTLEQHEEQESESVAALTACE